MNEVIEYQEESPNNAVVPIGDETLIQLAEQAEKRIDAMVKIKRIALKSTNRSDWVDQGGKPYLQVSGAEKIARMFGISWRISEPVLETAEGGHFSYTYRGNFSVAGATIDAIGTRSSKDPFFKRYSGRGDDRVELPPSEIDKGDLKKAAYTNCIGNGITRLLGIRNMTYEDLQEFAGITPDQLGKVDYKQKGKAKEEIKSEGALTAIIDVADVRKQTGTNKKTNKPWVKFVIKSGDGVEYGTFSESLANVAKEARECGLKAEITYKAGQYGNDIEAVKKMEPTDADLRQPGEEG